MEIILITLVCVLLTAVIYLLASGKPLKIEIKHTTEVINNSPTIVEDEESKEVQEMATNAQEILKKFNEEWGGIDYE